MISIPRRSSPAPVIEWSRSIGSSVPCRLVYAAAGVLQVRCTFGRIRKTACHCTIGSLLPTASPDAIIEFRSYPVRSPWCVIITRWALMRRDGDKKEQRSNYSREKFIISTSSINLTFSSSARRSWSCSSSYSYTQVYIQECISYPLLYYKSL